MINDGDRPGQDAPPQGLLDLWGKESDGRPGTIPKNSVSDFEKMRENPLSDTLASSAKVGVVSGPHIVEGTNLEKNRELLLPTRIITYAWGKKYVDELLSLTLPALLAPGNLPHVVTKVPCEVIILTEKLFFPRFLTDAAVARIQELCSVRLLPLDDLVSEPDKYGMALTYVLHRGLADLGSTVTDHWLMFLNADFILADGSLRTLLDQLAAGERLVASPSYCANAETVVPQLLRCIDPQTRTMSLTPRELASLVLRNRHNTIRGKTVNQSLFSIRYMDQFYWEVDSNTLLGHQMPIAIVGMRPERCVAEPNSYWDHGLMREFVPETAPCVLGDSDDFLMLEFRGEKIAEDQLRLGWPDPSEIARYTRSFLTPYQREMARYPLTLHAADLPAHVDEERSKLRAYVETVLAHVPAVLPSHLDHPQWDYHRPGFIKGRHEYLSGRLGNATETHEPPTGLAELDRLWWKLDGLKKSHERRRRELTDVRDHQHRALLVLADRLEKWVSEQHNEIDRRFAAHVYELSAARAATSDAGIERMLRPAIEFRDECPGLAAAEGPPSAPLAEHTREWLEFDVVAREKRDVVAEALEEVDRRCQNRLAMLELEFQAASRQLQFDYDRLVKHRVISAAIPYVAMRRGSVTVPEPASKMLWERLSRRVYHLLFRRRGRYTKIHPYWAAMRHVAGAVDRAAAAGARDVLTVISRGGIADRVADSLPVRHAEVALAEALQGNLAAAFNRVPEFDLCLCTLGAAEIYEFADLVRAIAPCMRAGGRIVGFYPNLDLAPSPPVDVRLVRALFDCPGTVQVHYAGSAASAWVLRRLRKVLSAPQRGRWRTLARFTVALLMLAPPAFAANRAEDLRSTDRLAQTPDPWSSLTIEVVV